MILVFLADAELFFTLCNRAHDSCVYFIFAWLRSVEAEVYQSHVDDTVALNVTFLNA